MTPRNPSPTEVGRAGKPNAAFQAARIAVKYASAFEAANGYKPDLSYAHGWFTVGRWPSVTKCRPAKLNMMAETLLALAGRKGVA